MIKTFTFLVITVAASRLLPHPPNLAPVTALALFAGAGMRFPKAVFPALIAMAISDFFIGFSPLPITTSVYGSFALISTLGVLLRKKKIWAVPLAAFASSMLFFIVTNFSVWLFSGMYEKTLAGLILCYINALPFLKNTIIGDIVYTSVIFGAFFFLPKLLPMKRHLFPISATGFNLKKFF